MQNFLLKMGANKNHLSAKGKSALIVASETMDFDMIQLLLLKGADVNKGNQETVSPLFWLTRCVIHKSRTSRSTLVELATCEHDKCLKLLISQGADVNKVNSEGRTPLMNACKKMNTSFVEILLDSGADVNARSKTGDTALMTACRTQSITCTKLLLKYGADVNALDNTHFNAVSMLKRQNLVEFLPVYIMVVQILFAAGIVVIQMTDFEQSCLDELCGREEELIDLKSICRGKIRANLMAANSKTNLFVLVPKLPLASPLLRYLVYNIDIND